MNIKKILDDHELWISTDGAEGFRANLRGAYLVDANFRDANFRGAYLRDAYLYNANFGNANLGDANFRDAYLVGANFRDANFGNANLVGANFRGANLRDANLFGADLSGAKGILQWQSPQGEKRICYSVKHADCVMHKLGCFWGTTDEAVEAIRKKYGEGSLYERFLLMQVEALEGE